MMMTSWAIVCDVYYLPPMTRNVSHFVECLTITTTCIVCQDNESAVDFAKRVKSEIAKRGGLVDLEWDGQLKRMQVKTEWRAQQQHEYSKRIKID